MGLFNSGGTAHRNANGTTTVKRPDGTIKTTLPKPGGGYGTVAAPAKGMSNVSSVVQPSQPAAAQFAATKYNRTNLDWPQANEVEKVAAAVAAVDAGAATASDIAGALGVVDRQGNYYADAAESLGLIERQDTTPATWSLTGVGEDYIASDPHDRVVKLAVLVDGHPAVQAVRQGEDVAVERAVQDGLSEYTAGRRASTAGAWAAAVDSLDVDKFSSEWEDTQRRLPSVLAEAKNRHHVRKAGHITRDICDVCWLEKSASGECGC